jgi:hypothetical protein
VSGFTGSAGTVVVTHDHAGLWTDSRYFIQAAAQLEGSGMELHKLGMPGVLDYPEWMAENLPANSNVCVDGLCMPLATVRSMQTGFASKGISIVNRPDLIDIAFLRYKRFTHQIHIQPPDDIAIRALIISALSKLNINNESAEKVEEVRDGQKYVYLKNQEKILEDITVEEIVNMAIRGLPSNDCFGSSPVKSGSYSAADIRGIIEEVCRMAIEEIQAEQEAHPEKEVKAKKLRRDMFIKAFKKIPPSISDALLKKYTDFRRADNGSNLAGDKK